MKRKELINLARVISDEIILRHLEYEGRRLTDYFLVGGNGAYLRGWWGQDGKPVTTLAFSEAEVMDFAIEQFLLRHVPVYETDADIPRQAPLS